MTREELLQECFSRSDFPQPVRSHQMRDELTGDVWANVDVYLRRVRIRHATRGAVVESAATTLTVLGIAQVCTDPAHRGKGFARAMVRAAHRAAGGESRPLKFAALFGLPEFYGPLGYFHPEGGEHPHFLVCKLADEEWPAGRVDTLGEW